MPDAPTGVEQPAPAPPPRKTRVLPFFATPAYGAMVTLPFMTSMVNLLIGLARHGVYPIVHTMGNESLITRARNNCVGEFLKTDATHLVFVDADVGFQAQHMVDMLGAGLDVVCGVYPKKEVDWERVQDAARSGKAKTAQDLAQYMAAFAVNFHEHDADANSFPVIEAGGKHFFQVKEAATGFCCIARHVIEAMVSAHGDELEYWTDSSGDVRERRYSIFDCAATAEGKSDLPLLDMRRAARAFAAGTGSADTLLTAAKAWHESTKGTPPRYLSEDWLFSRRAADLGFKVYVYAAAQLTHTGAFTFYGNFKQMFQRSDGPQMTLAPAGERAAERQPDPPQAA